MISTGIIYQTQQRILLETLDHALYLAAQQLRDPAGVPAMALAAGSAVALAACMKISISISK